MLVLTNMFFCLQNYSTDDWEAVRAEILTHLRRLDILASMEK